MHRLLRLLLWLLAGLAIAALAFAAYLLATYPTEYLRRVFTYFQSDINDYLIFPERAIAPSPDPFHFSQPDDPSAEEDRVRAAFEQDPLVGGDLEQFLIDTDTRELIVIQDDRLLYEQYFNGSSRMAIVTSFSSAKSFVSALVGIAIAEGKIGSVDDPITRYLPELAARDPRFSEITVRHLLNMSSGIRYVETGFVNGDDALTYYYPDLRTLALENTRIAGQPGETWLYNNYHPLLLGLILERATGVPVAEYLEQKIWQPIGAEYPASWSLDSQETGFEKMESGINARAIDLAKFGRLYLNEGNWDGKQIVPQDWVQASTRLDPSVDRASYYPDSMSGPSGDLYHQFLWWGVQQPDGDYGFMASGRYGQSIFAWPEKRLIVVRHGQGDVPGSWLGLFSRFADQWGE